MKDSVAKGPKLRPQNTKGPKKFMGPNFWHIYKKKAENGGTFL
jgi:hypothetical protein